MEKIKRFLLWFRQSRFYNLSILVFILILLTILMDRLLMPLYVKLGEETEMPDVIEMHVDDARDLLTSRGFKVLVRDSMYDADHSENFVIEQNPYPYATVKEGRRVYLTISIGEKPIVMPNLFGVSPREAELILDSYGLNLNARNYVYSDIYHEGTVIGQSYPQGQEINAGSNIDITISLGKLKEDLIVPDLVGKSLHEARQRLRSMELDLGEIEYEERSNILPETVIRQSIPAGNSFDPGQTIDLTVSKEESGG
jgi:serine/threonine-protein kinase